MKSIYLLLGLAMCLLSCNRQDQETPEPTDFGYLSMNISVSITSEPASGRVAAVPTDDWKVTIFDASDDSEVVVFDPYSSAPSEVQLPTGEYYVEAHSNNFMEAAFENPYYFGRSANFMIDKEELTPIDINAELANSKVAINYSSNVTSTFNQYTGAVTVVSTGATLPYAQGETREGYFVSEPLAVVVDLSYTKLDGTFITRQFTASIDAQPKTLYSINVDATLEDGEIVLNINVDESFNTEEINIGDIVVVTPDPNTAIFDATVYPLVDAYIDDRAAEDPLEIGSNTHFGYEVGVSDAAFVVFTETGGQQYFVGTNGASMKIYFTLFAPDQSTFINGTFNYVDQNTTTIDVVGGQPFFSAGEIEFDDDGILPNGDFEDAEYSITGGTVTVSGTTGNYTVEFDLETTGGPAVGNFTGDFQYLDNTAN
ncbi:MAG: DUF4493 domain-containing protein [Cyclobacteriaceae bacterium]